MNLISGIDITAGALNAQKTRLDVKMIAKAKRILKRDAGEGRMKRKIPSRGFSKPTVPVRIPSRPFGTSKRSPCANHSGDER